MADHPLLFRPEMVRALLDGRKTQTRRPAWRERTTVGKLGASVAVVATAAQRIKVGDLIWVKETHRPSIAGGFVVYRADPGREETTRELVQHDPTLTWRPSIHLPRKWSRITLVVTGVKIERLQDISDDDAIAEGIDLEGAVPGTDFNIDREWWPGGPRRQYRRLYERIHGADAWTANPEVVAITFTVHKANIDAVKTKVAA